uniref:Uncharacterized protein n=1 Tax=viral metagenome TaxID=1070528 RepID=A0A6C0JHC0_9ZZZZ
MGNSSSNPIQNLIDQYNRLSAYRAQLQEQLNSLNVTYGYLNSDNSAIINQYNRTMAEYSREIGGKQGQLKTLKKKYEDESNNNKQLGNMNNAGNKVLSSAWSHRGDLAMGTAALQIESNLYKTNLFNNIQTQNYVLDNEYNHIQDGFLKYEHKSAFQSVAISSLTTLNTILYYTFYILLLVYIYLLFFNPSNMTIYFKLFLILLLAAFPFFIGRVEKTVYFVWTYIYAFLTGSRVNNLTESQRAVIEQTTDLRVSGPDTLVLHQ